MIGAIRAVAVNERSSYWEGSSMIRSQRFITDPSRFESQLSDLGLERCRKRTFRFFRHLVNYDPRRTLCDDGRDTVATPDAYLDYFVAVRPSTAIAITCWSVASTSRHFR
jgi:hypothetical protein